MIDTNSNRNELDGARGFASRLVPFIEQQPEKIAKVMSSEVHLTALAVLADHDRGKYEALRVRLRAIEGVQARAVDGLHRAVNAHRAKRRRLRVVGAPGKDDAGTSAPPVAAYHFACINPSDRALHISCFDGSSIRVDGTAVTRVRDTDIHFAVPADASAWPINAAVPANEPDVTERPGLCFAPKFPGLKPDDVALVFWVWAFGQYLRPHLRTKPIGLAVGPPGSGKTVALSVLGLLLLGPKFQPLEVPANDSRNLPTVLSKRPYVLLDNIESMDGQEDALARAATGRTMATRRLYSDPDADNAEVVVTADVFLGMSTFSPSWLRADLLDRSLVFRFAPPADGKFIPESEFRRQAAEYRPHFLRTAVRVANEVTARINQGGLPKTASSRLAEFSAVGSLIAEALGGQEMRAQFLEALRLMEGERLLLLAESEPVIGALVAWMSNGGAGSEVTAGELYTYLAEASGVTTTTGNPYGFRNTVGSAAALGKALQALRTKVSGLVTIDTRMLKGKTRYRFTFSGKLAGLFQSDAGDQ